MIFFEETLKNEFVYFLFIFFFLRRVEISGRFSSIFFFQYLFQYLFQFLKGNNPYWAWHCLEGKATDILFIITQWPVFYQSCLLLTMHLVLFISVLPQAHRYPLSGVLVCQVTEGSQLGETWCLARDVVMARPLVFCCCYYWIRFL